MVSSQRNATIVGASQNTRVLESLINVIFICLKVCNNIFSTQKYDEYSQKGDYNLFIAYFLDASYIIILYYLAP